MKALSRLLLIALPLFSSTILAAGDPEQSNDRVAYNAYEQCMETSAHEYAKSTASPSEIAEAAQSKCWSEHFQFQKALEDRLMAAAKRRFLADKVKSEAASIASSVRQKLKGRVIQIVIEDRTKPAAP